MKVSTKLTDLFADYDHKLVESFLNSFVINFFLMHTSLDGNIHVSSPKSAYEDDGEGSYFYNSSFNYICAIYDQTDDEIVDKFERFANIKVFV